MATTNSILLRLLLSVYNSEWTTTVEKLQGKMFGKEIGTYDLLTQRRFHAKSEMGGYHFPILEMAKLPFMVFTFAGPNTVEEYNALRTLLHRDDVVLSYTDGGRFVVVLGDFKLRDLDIHSEVQEIVDATGTVVATKSKTVKRNKTVARPIREDMVIKGGLRVLVLKGTNLVQQLLEMDDLLPVQREFLLTKLEDSPELDGGFVVARHVVDAIHSEMELGHWLPAQRADLIRRMDKNLMYNGRGIGLRAADPDDHEIHMWLEERGIEVDRIDRLPAYSIIKAILKGNCGVCPMPEGIDAVTTWDNLKKELYGGENALGALLLEAQSAKAAFMDQQHITTNPWLLDMPTARKNTHDWAENHFAKVVDGTGLGDLDELMDGELNTPLRWGEGDYTSMMRWVQSAWFYYGGNMHDSPWLTERYAHQFVQQIGMTTPKKWMNTMRIPLPYAERAQVVSQSFINLCGEKMKVKRGTIVRNDKYKVYVVNDIDWVLIVILSHGGCDLDDFFVVRHVFMDGEKKVIISRNPVGRGEYSIWDYVEGSTVPYPDGDPQVFPVIKKTRRTKQILTALSDGSTKYMELPSELEVPVGEVVTRPYARKDVEASLLNLLQSEGAVGRPMIALWILLHLSATNHLSIVPNGEQMVDKFTQGDGSLEDQQAFLAWADEAIQSVIESGKGVDPILAARVIEEFPNINPNGPLSQYKDMMTVEVDAYWSKVVEFTQGLEIPEYLPHLGRNEHYHKCVDILKALRRINRTVNRENHDLEPEDRMKMILALQNQALEGIIDPMDANTRRRFVVAMWYACLTTKTVTTEKVSDQMVFGTVLFPHLLQALVAYGILRKPDLTHDGRIEHRVHPVSYNGEGSWTAQCVHTCGREFDISIQGLNSYLDNKGICKACRDSK